MDAAIEYLKNTYDPVAMILYGSYADGTMDQNSDLDILVITRDGIENHDLSVIDGLQLDAFVQNLEQLRLMNPMDYIQLYDGKVIFRAGFDASELINQVRAYVHQKPAKSHEQICQDVQWCEKMLERVGRCDPEGFYRWHWVLTESLEIFCEMMGRFYFGPKKSILWMKEHAPESYEIYCRALAEFDIESLKKWIAHLRACLERM